MGKINVLSFAVANLIAAGEVVDRPSSVIKELMENAIDSGADRITVEIQNGGVVFMRVSDNGCGIEKDDLSVAVRRHATSKIKEAEDLDGIITLGFRGEALAAIAAVSDLRIISRVKEQPTGAVIEVSGGNILGVYDKGCSEGTSVIVENLFNNVPARRKFLKKDVTETAAVHAVVEKVALSHPEISFTFIADGNIKLQTVGDGKLLNTIYSLYGRDIAKKMLEVDYEYEGVRVKGYTGRSDCVKPNRNSQNFFINGRLVKSKTVSAAVEQAYCSYIPSEKFPICTLFIDINPKAVDVNVHPAKLEVKFSNEKPIFEAVYYGIKNVLENNTSRPTISAESLANISYEEYKKLFSSTTTTEKVENQSTVEVPKTQYTDLLSGAKKPDASVPSVENSPQQQQENIVTPDDDKDEPFEYTMEKYAELCLQNPPLPDDKYDNINWDIDEIGQTIDNTPATDIDNYNSNAMFVQQEMCDASIPEYRIVGEVFNCYVIVETADKMLLIDKHAAHERIIFENLKKGLQNIQVQSQILMLPCEFMLTSQEVATINEYHEEIEKIGFQFTTEKYNVCVTAIPDNIELSAIQDMFITLADRIKNETGSVSLTRDIMFEKALYQASCKAAIKAGREYGEQHIKWLVDKMMELPDITFCPHGRPVAMEMKKSGLDRQFKRT